MPSSSQPSSTTYSTDSGYILPDMAAEAVETANLQANQNEIRQPPSYEISMSQMQQANRQALSQQEQQTGVRNFPQHQYPQQLPSMTADEV